MKKTGGLGEAAPTSGDAGGLMGLKMTRTGSLSGAWMMKTRRWALSMPLGPSCLLRYPLRNQLGSGAAILQLLSHGIHSVLSHTEGPQGTYSRGARA